jgi:hypothetical protein
VKLLQSLLLTPSQTFRALNTFSILLSFPTFLRMNFDTFIKTLRATTPSPQSSPSSPSSTSLDLETVKKALESKGLIVKSFRGLNIVTYTKRFDSDKPKIDFKDALVRECRGLIFDNDFNVVCPGFVKFYDNETDKYFMTPEQAANYVPELSLDGPEFAGIFGKSEIDLTYAVDSSLVRLYYNDGRWKLATTRSIDASKTRWNSYRTFFQLFCDGCESIFSPLDWKNLPQDKVYFLALVHPENRIVTPHTHSMLIHLTTFAKNENGVWMEDLTSDLGVARAIPFSLVKDEGTKMNLTEFQEAVKQLNWVYPGVVVRWTDDSGVVQRTKVRNPAYERVARLRGERRSMVERYLELKTDADKQEEFKEFIEYYPEYKSAEQSIENLARTIHQMYLDFHVHHTIRFISDKQIWAIIQELHTRFLRTKEKTSLHLARQHINSLPFPVLAELLVDSKRTNERK